MENWRSATWSHRTDRITHRWNRDELIRVQFLARKRALSNHFFGFNIKQRDLFQVELNGHLFTQME